MRLLDWVALAVVWWRGGGCRAIGRWLLDPGGAGCPGGGRPGALEEVLDRLGLAGEEGAGAAALRRTAGRALDRAREGGVTPVPWSDPRYPTALAVIADPPPVLWLRGDPAALSALSVALVGSRAGSPYAREVAYELGSRLGERGVSVVSGLARGVDAAAHRGALAVAGRTVAVLGSGVDIVYPPEHRALAAQVAERGALVSELLPGTPPRAAHFPLRNRLISGLSQAVVVVEAARRSGSLITARLALEQGREVMAVPGSILGGRNRGAHALLKDGAKVVEDVDDILEELRVPSPAALAAGGGSPTDPLLRRLEVGESYDFDRLMALSGLDGPRLLARLLEFELSGQVVRGDGGRFVRCGPGGPDPHETARHGRGC